MAGKIHIRRFHKQIINNRMKVRTVFNMFIDISRYQVCNDSMFIRDRINTTFKISYVRRQCLHYFAALGALGSKSSRSGFMRRFMMTDLLSVDSAE